MTAKQDAARTRNWRIRNLRALYALCYQMKSPRREQMQALIDAELVDMGARTQRQHQDRIAGSRPTTFAPHYRHPRDEGLRWTIAVDIYQELPF